MIKLNNLLKVVFLLAVVQIAEASKVIHREKSLYRNIVVSQSGNKRCLAFAIKKQNRNQSCINLRSPKKVVFAYVRMSFAGLLVNDNPGSILVVGLGGGTIPAILSELYPRASVDVVEIDSAVKRVAQDYFMFRETDQIQVFIQDARVYIKRAGIKGTHYDMIILDAFTGDYIPEHLMTVEFLQQAKQLLGSNGVLVANTFSSSKLYDHESSTYLKVFGPFYNLKMPRTGNRVIVATGRELYRTAELNRRAARLAAKLAPFGINITDFPGRMNTVPDWDVGARALTDQFAPANLLREN